MYGLKAVPFKQFRGFQQAGQKFRGGDKGGNKETYTYPRLLFHLQSRHNWRDHGPYAYCNNFSYLALALAAGVGPGARGAIRHPSTRSSP
jgi:hypothetical protein